MKKATIFLTIGLLLSFGLTFNSCSISDKNAATELDPSMIDSENPAIMTFDTENYNVGDVAVGSVNNFVFKFKNTGKSVLVIHDVKPSCGCTVPKGWPKDPIPPGGTGEIPIEFKPNMAGTINKTVSIVATTNPSVTKLTISGNAIGVD
jgi:hypothetical protein